MKAKRQTEAISNSATMLDGFGGHVKRIGIPVDAPAWENFLRKRDQVRLEITKDCPVYEKTVFSMGRFGAFLKALQLDRTWPHTPKTGI
jgi:hypothetical protein